jgi:hypothetical protein
MCSFILIEETGFVRVGASGSGSVLGIVGCMPFLSIRGARITLAAEPHGGSPARNSPPNLQALAHPGLRISLAFSFTS